MVMIGMTEDPGKTTGLSGKVMGGTGFESEAVEDKGDSVVME